MVVNDLLADRNIKIVVVAEDRVERRNFLLTFGNEDLLHVLAFLEKRFCHRWPQINIGCHRYFLAKSGEPIVTS